MNTQNMTYEELKKRKEEKINEWLEYLINNNEKDVLWKEENEIFVNSVSDYLYLMKKEKQDNLVDRQLEIIQPVPTYINDLNREKVYNVVKQLKDLEDDETINELTTEVNEQIAEIKKLWGGENINELITRIDKRIAELEEESEK